MPTRLLTLTQALDKASGYSKRHLLLGNGFSIACEPRIFTYGSLFERAKPDMSEELLRVFKRLGTTDFEEVIRALRRASQILPIYLDTSDPAARMTIDAESLKGALVKAVAGQHPARPNLIADHRYAACRAFLAKFIGSVAGGKVYTVNYDLLLYWALMHEPDVDDGLGLDHEDGFRKDPDYWDADYVVWHGEVPFLGQVEQINPDLRRPEKVGRFAKMAGEPDDLRDIHTLGVRCQVADLHVLDHATKYR